MYMIKTPMDMSTIPTFQEPHGTNKTRLLIRPTSAASAERSTMIWFSEGLLLGTSLREACSEQKKISIS